MTGYNEPDRIERRVLDALQKNGPLYSWEIVRRIRYGEDGRTIVPVLRRLEAKGLVQKFRRSVHTLLWEWTDDLG